MRFIRRCVALRYYGNAVLSSLVGSGEVAGFQHRSLRRNRTAENPVLSAEKTIDLEFVVHTYHLANRA